MADTKGKQQDVAWKRDKVIVCDSCHYSTDFYNSEGVCERCLRAKNYWATTPSSAPPPRPTGQDLSALKQEFAELNVKYPHHRVLIELAGTWCQTHTWESHLESLVRFAAQFRHNCTDPNCPGGLVERNNRARAEAAPQSQPDFRKALQDLVDALQRVHDSDAHRGVWTLYAVHGGKYPGPFYSEEFEGAKLLLSRVAAPPVAHENSAADQEKK